MPHNAYRERGSITRTTAAAAALAEHTVHRTVYSRLSVHDARCTGVPSSHLSVDGFGMRLIKH